MTLARTTLGRKGGGEPLQRPQRKGKVFPSGRVRGLVGVIRQGPKGVHPGGLWPSRHDPGCTLHQHRLPGKSGLRREWPHALNHCGVYWL